MHTYITAHRFSFWHGMKRTAWLQGMPPLPPLLEIPPIIPLGISAISFMGTYPTSFSPSTNSEEGKSEKTEQEAYPEKNKDAAPPLGTFDYIVGDGDTIFQIAKKFTTTMHAIIKVNRLDNSERISPGQVIKIPQSPPGAVIYTVRPGDSLQRIATRYSTDVGNIVMFNYTVDPDLIYPGQQLIIPVDEKD